MSDDRQRTAPLSGLFWPFLLPSLIGYAAFRLLLGWWLSGTVFLFSLLSFMPSIAWWHESLVPLAARFGLMATLQTWQIWLRPSCFTLSLGFFFLLFMALTVLSF